MTKLTIVFYVAKGGRVGGGGLHRGSGRDW